MRGKDVKTITTGEEEKKKASHFASYIVISHNFRFCTVDVI